MGKKSKSKKTAADRIARLVEVASVEARIETLVGAMENEHDLVCAIVMTSFVDSALSAVLKEHYNDEKAYNLLFDVEDGLVHSLRARSDLAYVLKLIPKKCKSTIDKIAEIRNLFAHTLDHHEFEDEEIGKLCDELKSEKFVPHELFVLKVEDGVTLDILFKDRRKTFETIGGTVCMQLISLANDIRKDRKFGGNRHALSMADSVGHQS